MAKRSNNSGSLYKRNGRSSWYIAWTDHEGKRQARCTKTTDKAAAQRILNKRLEDAALRREGIIDAETERYTQANRKSLSEHIDDYLQDCENAGQSDKNVAEKRRHLDNLLKQTGISRLSELDAHLLTTNMARMKSDGYSARSCNFRRQAAVAFASWCVKHRRLPKNLLLITPRQNEDRDRRRVRRPLTDDELARLLEVAGERGRRCWYLLAALAGLRRGDLIRLQWRDIDFDQQSITIRHGKAKRTDVIPMHPQLTQAMKQRRDEAMAIPRAKVFPQVPTTLTQQKDLLRAGMAHEEVVTDQNGEPVMIGKRNPRPKTRIVMNEDDQGRVVDLHALRATLGTRLARQGVPPQIAQRIMRHSDYQTTLKHYTVLGLSDDAAVISSLPAIGSTDKASAAEQ